MHTLRFRAALDLGFAIVHITELLARWQKRDPTSADVKCIAQPHMANLDWRLAEMAVTKQAQAHLVHCCQRDARLDCPNKAGSVGEAGADG